MKLVPCATAPEAPHISSVDYSHGVLNVGWMYGEPFIDLSHSRMLHWQVEAEGKKRPERSYSIYVSLLSQFTQFPPTHSDTAAV